MPSNSAMIHARIDPNLKKNVENILKRLGMTSAEAIRLFFSQIADKKSIPFVLDLEGEDLEENYQKISNEADLKHLIGLDEI